MRRLLARPDQTREREALTGVEESGRQAVGRAAPHARHPAQARRRRRARPVAVSLKRVDELVRSTGLDATLDDRGRARRPRPGPRHLRVPDRPGGADQRACATHPARTVERHGRLRPATCALEVRDDGAKHVNGHAADQGLRPRDHQHARARRPVRRRARSAARDGRRLRRQSEAAAYDHPSRDRRRPAAGPRRPEDGARRRGRHRGRRRGRRRRGGPQGRPQHQARRRADGHPHAGPRRAGGLAPPARHARTRRRSSSSPPSTRRSTSTRRCGPAPPASC